MKNQPAKKKKTDAARLADALERIASVLEKALQLAEGFNPPQQTPKP